MKYVVLFIAGGAAASIAEYYLSINFAATVVGYFRKAEKKAENIVDAVKK